MFTIHVGEGDGNNHVYGLGYVWQFDNESEATKPSPREQFIHCLLEGEFPPSVGELLRKRVDAGLNVAHKVGRGGRALIGNGKI